MMLMALKTPVSVNIPILFAFIQLIREIVVYNCLSAKCMKCRNPRKLAVLIK